MTKLFSLGAIGAVALLAAPAFGAFYIAGDFQGWDPGSTIMTDNLDGSWSYTVTGQTPGVRQEFKITVGDWSTSYPGPNSWYYTDGAGNASVTFYSTSAGDGWAPDINRIGVAGATSSWTAVGNWQHFTVTGSDWNNADPASVMTDQGGGIYKYSIVVPSAGSYEYKAVRSGSWDAIGTDTRNVNAGTWLFTTTDPNQMVDMYVNAGNGSVKVDVIPIPEPATAGLLALAGLSCLGRRRRA